MFESRRHAERVGEMSAGRSRRAANGPLGARPAAGHRRAASATVGRVQGWDPRSPGVLRLPSGRLIRGRGLRRNAGQELAPEFGLYLLRRPPAPMDWRWRWVRWPDWWLPVDRADARDGLVDLWRRAEAERVEVACAGGRGRTGTSLACLAVLDGVPPRDAVAYVRRGYHPKAVETPWQRRYVRRFEP